MAEIMALKVPSIFTPSPYVANNHQYYNALDLVNKGCGLMLEEKNLSIDTLDKLINETLNDKDKLKKIKDNLGKSLSAPSSEIILNKIKEVL